MSEFSGDFWDKQADEYYLREVFVAIAEAEDLWRRHPMECWKWLYAAVVEKDAPAAIYQHIADQEERIIQLEWENHRLRFEAWKRRQPPEVL